MITLLLLIVFLLGTARSFITSPTNKEISPLFKTGLINKRKI